MGHLKPILHRLETTAESSPLMLASHNGYTEIAKLLKEHGAKE